MKRAALLLLSLTVIFHSCSLFKKKEETVEPYVVVRAPSTRVEEEPEEFFICLEDFSIQLRKQFETHGILLNVLITNIMNEYSFQQVHHDKKALIENVLEISDFFIPIYGRQIAYQLQNLLIRQIELETDTIVFMRLQQHALAKQAEKETYYHADMIVEFLNILNPFYPKEVEQKMFEEYITLLFRQADLYFSHDCLAAQKIKAQSLGQLQELADHIALAMDKQIKDKPIISRPDSNSPAELENLLYEVVSWEDE